MVHPPVRRQGRRLGHTGRVDIGGYVKPGFEPVREVFARVLAGQAGTGAAAAAWRDGGWLVDLWGGRASADGSQRWQAGSLAQAYSVVKPFVAVSALLLADRGQLDLDAPVQRYWPQFRAAADVRQVLSHQAGVVALDEPAPTEAFYDWDRLCALLAAQEPAWEPGPRMARRRCSTGIWWASSFPGLTGAGWGVSSAKRCAARWAWTTSSGSPRPSRPAPSS